MKLFVTPLRVLRSAPSRKSCSPFSYQCSSATGAVEMDPFSKHPLGFQPTNISSPSSAFCLNSRSCLLPGSRYRPPAAGARFGEGKAMTELGVAYRDGWGGAKDLAPRLSPHHRHQQELLNVGTPFLDSQASGAPCFMWMRRSCSIAGLVCYRCGQLSPVAELLEAVGMAGLACPITHRSRYTDVHTSLPLSDGQAVTCSLESRMFSLTHPPNPLLFEQTDSNSCE